MKTKAVLKRLLDSAEDDWLALWMIAQDVEEELGIEDPIANLEMTLQLVRELLKRGLRAGDSPVANTGVHFRPWPNQDPELIVDFIRREWLQRAALPSWGDGPWFAPERRALSA
jgi:hypothetical protein